MIGIKLPKYKKETIGKLEEYLKPKYTYFSITNNELLVKENDQVIVGQKLMKTKFDSYIHSSISGKVIGIEEKLNYKNEQEKFLKIENDFKEKNNFKENKITNISKEKFIYTLKENGIIGLGGAGFPTYIKYNNEIIETLIINAVECEPYITADYTICLNNIKEIVETLNIIIDIYNIKEVFLAIKVNNRKLKETIIPYIAESKKIKLIEVPNLYPMGWERTLVRYIKHIDYDKLPIEKNIVVSNASTIYSIYEALKYNKPLIEKIITISGNAIKNKTNVKIKIGTSFKELIDIFKGYKYDEITLISGGPMMGESINSDDFIISNNLNCVIGLKKQIEVDPTICLRCGKCNDNCPAKICPVLVKDNINNKEELQKLDVFRCIECGICSFVCPAKINLREYVKNAKKKVK